MRTAGRGGQEAAVQKLPMAVHGLYFLCRDLELLSDERWYETFHKVRYWLNKFMMIKGNQRTELLAKQWEKIAGYEEHLWHFCFPDFLSIKGQHKGSNCIRSEAWDHHPHPSHEPFRELWIRIADKGKAPPGSSYWKWRGVWQDCCAQSRTSLHCQSAAHHQREGWLDWCQTTPIVRVQSWVHFPAPKFTLRLLVKVVVTQSY